MQRLPERGVMSVMEQMEEEMIREEEITWEEAESAKQQQEAELDLQAAEDEDEATLAAHLDFGVELDTSEWDQNNNREYGTPSPVRRWRDELMAKKDREEEEENRMGSSAAGRLLNHSKEVSLLHTAGFYQPLIYPFLM